MILFVLGTRPEAIKLAPLIKRVSEAGLEYKVCITSQHRELLLPFLEFFEIFPDINLDVMRENQDLFYLTSEIITRMKQVLKELEPKLLVVQGDTTTTFTASIAAHYLKIPIAHVEAGLRSKSLDDPHPEEMNRRLTDHISELLFAPTNQAQANLLREGIASEKIYVTGNTIVDAIHSIRKDPRYQELRLPISIHENQQLILITAHRRENFGVKMLGICRAIRELVAQFPNLVFAFPVHPNPNVKDVVEAKVNELERVHLLPPLAYLDMLRLIERSDLILTDSGGLQEEAPSFNKSLLVLRETTERQEGIDGGIAKLIGTNPQVIIDEVTSFFSEYNAAHKRPEMENPYGDGNACERIVSILIDHIS
jgi:UDP-N-acetylglucosamine 2-epimerase (non-hydrolysing)